MGKRPLITGAIERRTILKGMAVFGLGSISTGTAPLASARGTTLGTFESGRDSWRTNGPNELKRVSASSVQKAVTQGEFALQVDSSGDPAPMIENMSRVKATDFRKKPYLLLDIFVGEFDHTNDPLTFTLRYHYNQRTAGNTAEQKHDTDVSRQKKSANVVESEPISLPQGALGHAAWDLSDIAVEKRAAPQRLEITWRLAGTDSKAGPRGRGSSQGIHGSVYFDNIRAVSDVSTFSRREYARKLQELTIREGTFEYEHRETTETSERGVFRFNSGATVPVAFEITQTDPITYQLTIESETFTFTGDTA